MAMAAVPNYLGQDFSTASPALRFGMYLSIWNASFAKENAKVEWLKKAGKLNANDVSIMKSLQARQQGNFKSVATNETTLQLDALSSAPFTTGLGNEHPLENGFAFLNPYGLPYLPGSGVKGVLRQAARELSSGDWGDPQGWSVASITALFGEDDDKQEARRGALSFWDVIPQIKGDALQVDIMTPHQKHYYQEGKTPHDSGQPIPINFLTVPPGSGFTFYVQCDLARLQKFIPELVINQQWKTLLEKAFQHAFNWLGFGAKTAVGYGAMAEDTMTRQVRQVAEAKVLELKAQQEEEQRLATLNPEDRAFALAQPILNQFNEDLAQAMAAGDFDPTGTFPQIRLDFINTALNWTETRSRLSAADLLEKSSTKSWGRPKKKERWKELQDAIAALRDD